MKKVIAILHLIALMPLSMMAQNAVGINTDTPDASSILEIVSTDKGVLIPRMSFAERNAIVSPVKGLLIFQNSGTEGFYYYDGSSWKIVGEDADWEETPSYIYNDDGKTVGIGTSTPDEDLHIYSTGDPKIKIQRQSASSEAGIEFYRSTGTGTLDASIYVNSNEELTIQNHESDKDILFLINDGGSTEQIMYFDASNKRIGVNLTSVPQDLFHINGAMRATGGIKAPNGSASAPGFRFYNDNSVGMWLNGNNSEHLCFSTNATLRLQIEPDGDLTPGSDNAYSLGSSTLEWTAVYANNGTIQSSDSTLKTNIKPLQYGLEDVLKMNAVQYNWKDNPEGELKLGLLAQEVREITPEVVSGEKEGELGMNYAELVPVLIKAIQELEGQVSTLSQQVETLSSEVEQLETQNSKLAAQR